MSFLRVVGVVSVGAFVVASCASNASGLSPVDAGDDVGSAPTGRAPFTSCLRGVDDAGVASYSSGLCADNPALAGCVMCLGFTDDAGASESLCVFACRVGMSDCPTGQTCEPQSGMSRNTQGSCRTFAAPSALGYCR